MTGSRTNSASAAQLLVELRRDLPLPLHRQLELEIRGRIRSGGLRAGAVLPATRALATDLGVSRGVVVEAYQQLVAEGYLVSRIGGYTQVAEVDGVSSVHDRLRVSEAPRPRIDFQYGLPDVSHFPRTAWLRSLRRVMVQTPSDRFNYLGGRGTPELRRALADYLNRVRATAAHPENVVICNGFTQGLTLLCQVLAASGARRVAVEDPSDIGARTLIATAGLEVVPIPVDGSGVRVDVLERRGADAVLVTAAHQCPTGVTLGAQSRSALIEWAARADALIIEDDYDAEYRYDRAPVGAIQGLGPEHVIYAGSASKTLAPGLRLGWMVVPSRLVDPIAAARHMADRGAPVLEQLALADFLSSGEFDRHLRRMRPIYRGRRDVLLAALARHLPGFRPSGVAAGLHVLTWLPAGLPEARVVEAATSQGVRVDPLAPYRIDDTGDGGVLFGYAGVPERLIAEGIESISQALA